MQTLAAVFLTTKIHKANAGNPAPTLHHIYTHSFGIDLIMEWNIVL